MRLRERWKGVREQRRCEMAGRAGRLGWDSTREARGDMVERLSRRQGVGCAK